MLFHEQKFYNVISLACNGDYFKIKSLWDKTGSWERAWNFLDKSSKIDPDQEWEKLRKLGIALILKEDLEYPLMLREIPCPPFGIYLKGNIKLLKQSPLLAIVGTRKATAQGREIAFTISRELSKNEIVIVSGLALGIDESAHQGVVANNEKTIAVLACGLERIYPAQNHVLGEKILALGGAIISEYPIGSATYSNRFLERNRIVSGLSSAIIVIEAPCRSGALVTAKFALEQNREVFVIPGSFGHKNYEGSHELIRSGASLVGKIDDLLEFLNISRTSVASKKISRELPFLDENQKLLLQKVELEKNPISVDKLVEITKLSPQVVNRSLSALIINNFVKEEGGRYYIS
jgi:DNA processing protein